MQLNNDCLLAVDFVLRVKLGGSGWDLLEWWAVGQELYILKVELFELSFKNIFLHLNISCQSGLFANSLTIQLKNLTQQLTLIS